MPLHVNTFTIAGLLNTARFPLLDQRINKMCSIHKIELYSTIKNEITWLVEKWKEVKIAM